MNFNKFPLVLISIAVLVFYFFLWRGNGGGNGDRLIPDRDGSINSDQTSQTDQTETTNTISDPKTTPKLEIDGQIVDFSFTDDNSGETIIIRTDKEVYKGFADADVYFSIQNTGNKSEKVALLFYFAKAEGEVKSIELINQRQKENLTLVKEDIRINTTVLGQAFKKREVIPKDFQVKAGTQLEVPAGQIAYFKSKISFPPIKDGEFWIEALGSNGGYGLLDPWYSSSYSNRKRIVIDGSQVASTSFTNFPVLITQTDIDLATTANGGKAASGSGEFVFTSSDGTTTVAHEIESYTATTGNLVAWVNVPTLNGVGTDGRPSDTILYVYFGGPNSGATNQNPTGTWNSNFVAVWHMNESAGTTVFDSTSNNNDLTKVAATEPNPVTGKIGGAQDFDGTNDKLSKTVAIITAYPFTFCSWFNIDNVTAQGNLIVEADTATTNERWLMQADGSAAGDPIRFVSRTGGTASVAITTTGYTAGTWYYVCGVGRSATLREVYLNVGGKGTNTTSSTPTGLDNITIGVLTDTGDGNFFPGLIDEVRVSNTDRPDDWLQTEYNNISSPQTFFAFGPLESATRSAPSVKVQGGVKAQGGVIIR